MHGITGEHYSIDDVLPSLNLRTAFEVGVDIEETGFKLFIRPREMAPRPPGCLLGENRFYGPLEGPQRQDL